MKRTTCSGIWFILCFVLLLGAIHAPATNTYAAQVLGVNEVSLEKLIAGARAEVARRPLYNSKYYSGGYPPEQEGVCTDVIWRAFRDAGINLKKLIDADIRVNTSKYKRVNGRPDSNIDFRRVPNQTVFFRRHWTSLNTKVSKNVADNLKNWQPGDIVVFTNPDHIAILSDKRNAQGLPYLLHNSGPWAQENDSFMPWYQGGFVAHFRLPKNKK